MQLLQRIRKITAGCEPELCGRRRDGGAAIAAALGLRGARAVLALGLLLLVLPGAAAAATLTVTRTDDPASATCAPSSCTLRAAIAQANTDGGSDTIVVPAGTYQLTTAGGGELVIKASMTIAGAGARVTTIMPAPSSRILQIEGGIVALDDLTLTGASVAAEGGAAEVNGSAAVTFLRDTLSNNDVEVGGIHDGGAIEDSSSGPLLIESSTLSGNNGYNGGAIYSSAPTTIVNSTLADNRAGTPTTNGDGGAMQVTKAVLINDTISGNECFNGGGCGGAFVGSVSAADTIIAGNRSNTGSITNCGGKATVTGPDIEDGTDCGFTTGGSKQEVDPKLGPLANNGGPTETMMPAAGSPAIDAATNATCATHDQRGGARPAPGGGQCDIGAVEVNSLADVSISGSVSPSSLLAGAAVVYTLKVTDLGPDPALAASVQNLLPAGATFAGAITSMGSCAGTTTLTCALGTLPSGATATINVSAKLGSVGTATDIANAAAPATDPTLANNQVSILASVLAPIAPVAVPTLTAVSQKHSTWRAGGKLATIGRARHKVPVGTAFSFTLNTPAQVSFTFTQSLTGRKGKGKCVASTRKNRRAHSCKRTVTIGVLSFSGRGGANTVSFQGRLSKSRKLRPGRYMVQIVASDSAGHSATQRLSFTVVR